MKAILKQPGVAALFLIGLPAAAHHSPTMYDRERDVTLEGVVTRFQWAYPHVYVDVETEGDAGENVTWIIEGEATNAMSKLGWSEDSLAPGERVVVTANPARDPSRSMARVSSVLKEDSTLLSTRVGQGSQVLQEDGPASFVATDLSGYWRTRAVPGLAVRFFGVRPSWPLTDKGYDAVDNYDESLNPGKDCVLPPLPFVMALSNVMNIELGEDVTVIRFEEAPDRTIHMNADSHDGAAYVPEGHSIGWWEDDVLVVDTTHFAYHRAGNGWGVPSSPQKHLVERFELHPDRTRLDYKFWLEDPEYLAEPLTWTLEMIYRPDLRIVNDRCDPQSARRYLED